MLLYGRRERTLNHKEAHCIMEYRCKGCGNIEMIWNSRDGVTPFIVMCLRCKGEMQHANWNKDFPQPVMRMFIDLTEDRARESAVKIAEHARAHSDTPPPPKGSVEYREFLEQLVKDLHGDGHQPDIVRIDPLAPLRIKSLEEKNTVTGPLEEPEIFGAGTVGTCIRCGGVFIPCELLPETPAPDSPAVCTKCRRLEEVLGVLERALDSIPPSFKEIRREIKEVLSA